MNPKLKKLLPIIAGIFIVVVVVVAFLIKGSKSSNSSSEEDSSNVPTLSENQWPAISLTPTDNPQVSGSMGHWLDFKVEKINIKGAVSMDWLLVYTTSDGGQQGVPGSVKLTGDTVEKKFLLGSESSGKYRYDAGVDTGTITITFRDGKGKMLGKLSTEFRLQTGVSKLSSADNSFVYNLDKQVKDVYFVTMKTYLKPSVAMVVWQDGYGIFSSDGAPHAGGVASE